MLHFFAVSPVAAAGPLVLTRQMGPAWVCEYHLVKFGGV